MERYIQIATYKQPSKGTNKRKAAKDSKRRKNVLIVEVGGWGVGGKGVSAGEQAAGGVLMSPRSNR